MDPRLLQLFIIPLAFSVKNTFVQGISLFIFFHDLLLPRVRGPAKRALG
jgi:hypothetical protein